MTDSGGFNLGSAYGSVIIDVSGIASAMGRAKADFDTGVSGMGQSLTNIGGSITQVAGSLSAVFTPAAIGIGIATNAAFDFNAEMTNTGAVLGLTTSEIALMGDEIQAMGADTRAGPQQVALAMYDIAGGVADASTHMAILNATIHTAQAGNANLTGTTKALVSVMNSYKFAADRAGFASDVLTRTVGMGVGSMDQFASAFPSITGLANSLSIEFDDLGGMMAYLTTQGNTASEAATQLGSMMTAMLNPNEKMILAIKELGFESGQAAIEALGLDGAYAALADTTVANQNGMAKLTGNVNALRGATSLAGDDVEGFMTKFKDGVEGATAAAEAIQLSSPQARLDLFNSTISNLAITLGETIIPRLAEIADTLKPVVDGLTLWAAENPRLTGGILMFIGALGIGMPILAGAGFFISAIGTAWTAMSTGIIATAAAAAVPFLLIGAGIAGVAYVIVNNINTIRDGLADLATALITGDWSTISDNIKGGIQGAVDGIQNFDFELLRGQVVLELNRVIHWKENDQWVKDVATSLRDAITGSINNPVNIGGLSLEGFRHSIQGAMATIMIDPRNSDSVDGLARAIYARVNGLEVSDETFGAFATRMQGSLSRAISNAFSGGNVGQLMPASVADSMGGAGGGIGAAITSQLTSAIASIEGVSLDTTGITAWATTNMNSIIDAVAAVAVAVIGGPVGLTIGAAKLVSSAIETDFLGIGTFLNTSGITASVTTAVETLKAQIGDIISSVFSGGGAGSSGMLLPESVAISMGGTGGGESNPIVDMVSRLVNGLKAGVEMFGPELRESLKQIGDGISAFITNLSGADTSGLDNIMAVVLGVVGAIGGIAGTILMTGIDIVSDVFENVLPKIGTAIGGIVTIISGIGEGDPSIILKGIGDGITGLVGAVGGVVSGVADPLIELIEKITGIQLPDVGETFRIWGDTLKSAWLIVQIFWDNLKRDIELGFLDIKIRVLGGIQDLIDAIAPTLESLNIQAPTVAIDLASAQMRQEDLAVGDEVGRIINEQLATTGAIDLTVPFTFEGSFSSWNTTLGEAIESAAADGALPVTATAALDTIGLSIVDGVVQGIDANTTLVTDSTTGLAQLATDAFTNQLGISSPSLVFMGYGANLVQGLALGMMISLPLILVPNLMITTSLANISIEAAKIPISVGLAFAQTAIAVNIAKTPIITALDQIAAALVKVTETATRAAAAIAAATNASVPTVPTLPAVPAAGVRDSGGPGYRGGAYIINPQAGPEAFIPTTPGQFIPNIDKLLSNTAGAGGSGTRIENLNIYPQINPAAGPVSEQARSFADEFMEEVHSR